MTETTKVRNLSFTGGPISRGPIFTCPIYVEGFVLGGRPEAGRTTGTHPDAAAASGRTSSPRAPLGRETGS